MWERLVGAVKDVAPTLAGAAGTALTGGNPLGGAALSALARRLTGAGEDEDLDAVAGRILADPEQLQRFRLESRRLELRELEIRTADVQHARETHRDSRAPAVISLVVVTGFFGMLALVMLRPVPESAQNLAYLLLGTLASAFSSVLVYWLGSSKGSKDKDRLIRSYADAARRDQQVRDKGAG